MRFGVNALPEYVLSVTQFRATFNLRGKKSELMSLNTAFWFNRIAFVHYITTCMILSARANCLSWNEFYSKICVWSLSLFVYLTLFRMNANNDLFHSISLIRTHSNFLSLFFCLFTFCITRPNNLRCHEVCQRMQFICQRPVDKIGKTNISKTKHTRGKSRPIHRINIVLNANWVVMMRAQCAFDVEFSLSHTNRSHAYICKIMHVCAHMQHTSIQQKILNE